MSISYTEINPNSKLFPNQVMVGKDNNEYPKVPVMNLTTAGWKSNQQLEADVLYLLLLKDTVAEEDHEEVVNKLCACYAAGTMSVARITALKDNGVISDEEITTIIGDDASESDEEEEEEEVKPEPEPEPQPPQEEEFKLQITTTLNDSIEVGSSFSKKFETNVPKGEESNVTWNYTGNAPDGMILAGDTISIQKAGSSEVCKFTMEATYKEQKATKACTLAIVDAII